MDGGRSKFILVEMGNLLRHSTGAAAFKKVAFTPEWKGGRPTRCPEEDAERRPHCQNRSLANPTRTPSITWTRYAAPRSSKTSSAADAGGEGPEEPYVLRYMLKVETRSPSLLDVRRLADPTSESPQGQTSGSDEGRGLECRSHGDLQLAARRQSPAHRRSTGLLASFRAGQAEKRLRLKGRIKPGPGQAGTGSRRSPARCRTAAGARHLAQAHRQSEEDNLVLDEWFTKQGVFRQGQRVRPHLHKRRQQPRKPQGP